MEITNTILFIGLSFLWIVFMASVAHFKHNITMLRESSEARDNQTLNLAKNTTKALTVSAETLKKLVIIAEDNANLSYLNLEVTKRVVALDAEVELLKNKLNNYINE